MFQVFDKHRNKLLHFPVSEIEAFAYACTLGGERHGFYVLHDNHFDKAENPSYTITMTACI
jgi:hypothetical protein